MKGEASRGLRIEVQGTVQGVGFRPWVYRLAHESGVRGRVHNDARGVTIEAFGSARVLEDFARRLRREVPKAARIAALRAAPIPAEALGDFVIDNSQRGQARAFSIAPDLATCAECLAEIRDPDDRRYGYAFTNCTHCGPRFTIATDIPYDRASTSMRAFAMCAACSREYADVRDRRFHAQPNACTDCGPRLVLQLPNGEDAQVGDPLAAVARLLRAGAIVAIKGLGGFHLACDAAREDVIRTLRARKRRDEKPFAVMVKDLAAARALADLSPEEEALLEAPERPIVLLRRAAAAPIDRAVAPDSDLLGLFLPYTPLHHLLLCAFDRPLVMTSANLAGEPICISNTEATTRLRGIADALLVHDREIETRCDDSVAQVVAGAPSVIRRSRGYVPRAIALCTSIARPVLACGAHLKNTFCLAAGEHAYLGPHVGDLDTLAALAFFEEAVERMQKILAIAPEVIAHDLHPAYASTRYAQGRPEPLKVAVQHHHAHVASAMAEHGLEGPVLGVAFDGTGYGDDGAAWGGELLRCRLSGYERLATFRPIKLPGSNRAMREVWRIALSLLHDAFDGEPPLERFALFRQRPAERLRVVQQLVARGLNAPPAHGVGRYFDALGALALNRPNASHEGQVALAFALAADPSETRAYPFAIDRDAAPTQADLRPTVRAAVKDLCDGASASAVSARFHNTLVAVTGSLIDACPRPDRALPVVLTGGVFQNARLAEGLLRLLGRRHRVVLHREVPAGDGGIALGQAIVADAITKGARE